MSLTGKTQMGAHTYRLESASCAMSSFGVQRAETNFRASLLTRQAALPLRAIWSFERSAVKLPRQAGIHRRGYGRSNARGSVLQCIAGDTTVRLTVQQQLPFGESLRIAGTGDALGNWDPASAPKMTWGEDDRWTSEVALSPGTYDFKLVIVRDENGTVAAWEPGENRSVTVDEDSGPLKASCVWSDTAATSLSCSTRGSEEKAEGAIPASPGAAAQVEAAQAEAESQGADLADITPAPPAQPTPVNQASEAPEDAEPIMPPSEPSAADLQKEEAPNAVEAVTQPEAETEASHPQLDSDAPTVPGAMEEWGVAGGGEGGDVTEQDSEAQMQRGAPEEAAPTSASAPGVEAPAPTHEEANSNTETETESETESEPEGEGELKIEAEQKTGVEDALASPTAAAKFEEAPSETEVGEGKLDIAAEGQTVAQAASGPQSQASFKTGVAAEQVTSVAESAAGPNTGLQGFVGLLGVLAVPVVGYSLLTLYKTGCGLPPGPSGLIGAAEGLSYVTLLGIAGWGIGMRATTSMGLPAGPGNMLGIAEGLSYLTLSLGAVVLTLQVKNYGYIPSALPDSKCYGDSGPKSASDVTKALADIFTTSEAPELAASSASDPASSSADMSSDADTTAEPPAPSTSARPAVLDLTDRSAEPSESPVGSGLSAGGFGVAGTSVTEVPQVPPTPSTSSSDQYQLPQLRPVLAYMDAFPLDSAARLAHQTSLDLAEASTSDTAAEPGDAQLNMTARKASRKLKELLERDQYEEVYSGALDGLSGSDIAPVVEELDNVIRGLVRLFTETLPNLASSIFRPANSAVMGSVGLTQGWMTGGLDIAQLARPLKYSSVSTLSAAEPSAGLPAAATATQGSPAHTAASRDTALETSRVSSRIESSLLHPRLLQVGLGLSSSLVTADIGFTAAATNAVSAVVNINNQVENMLGPLRQAAADMRSLVSQIADLAASVDRYESAAQVDRESLARSAEQLQSILGTATEKVSASSSGLPGLVAQLQTAVSQLRNANGSAARADAAKFQKLVNTLEAAVAALSDASVSLDVRSSLEAAKLKVEEEVRTEQGATEPVAETAERAVDPAVQGIERAVSRLQDALSDLDTAVDAARGFKADAAPPVKD